MKYYFITGTTSGIGYALVQSVLNQENVIVYGVSRRQVWEDKNYKPVTIDLASPKEVMGFIFPELKDAEKIVLINNAGQIGDIKPIGKSDNSAIADLMNVNVTAPAILMNNFIEAYSSKNVEKTILNVSSGAGKNAIEGWAPYCGSKAAIDLLSLTAFEEQKRVENPVKIYSVAPGVVDTEMQVAIRNSNEEDFTRHAHFVDLKTNNGLTSPQEVASKYLRIIGNTSEFSDCIFSLRDVE
jgi:benzil reductase ((S)-benzoin forming)